MKFTFSFKFFSLFTAFLAYHCNAQNKLLPVKYLKYKYAVNSILEMDTFTQVLYSAGFIDDTLKVGINKLTQEKKLHCFLDILTQSRNTYTFYNIPGITDFKKDFLSKLNQLRKHESLKMLDSIWYEYFRDTLNSVSYVKQYSGYKLCMRSRNTIVKERIYIPITNTGQFYESHYFYNVEQYLTKTVNKFLSTLNSPYRLVYYSNPLFWDEIKKGFIDQDGVGFVFLDKSQFEFFKSHENLNQYYNFSLFYTHFDDYNTNGKKTEEINHIINANLMWYYDEPTQRSIIRIMNESSFENLSTMLNTANVNNTIVTTSWGVDPEHYTRMINELVEHTKKRVQARIVYDKYSNCKADSFDFKVEAQKKVYSRKFKCGSELDPQFLKLLYDLVKDCIPGRLFYLATISHENYFYVILTEDEKEYIVNNNVFTLYNLAP